MDDDAVLLALSERAHDNRWLYQFRSIVAGHQYRKLYALVRRHVPAGAEVLDWGAGSGHFSFFLRRTGYRTTGFSIDARQSPDWLDDPDYRFVRGSGDDPVHLPFADASFDAVSSVGVLEHVRETGGTEAASLREIRRVLRPGGVFLCYHFPNRFSAIETAVHLVPGKRGHLYRYTPREVERLVGDADLELVERARYGFLPRNLWQNMPRALRDSSGMARVWDGLDDALGTLAPALCQNHLFVARRPGSGVVAAAGSG